MKILISGAAGYIGSNLMKKLIGKKHKLFCLYNNTKPCNINKQVELIKYDGTFNSINVINTKIDIIIHLATLFSFKTSNEIIDKMMQSNIVFGVHLLEFAKSKNIKKFINTSSYAQSIDNKSYSPQNFYTSTKQAFEDILKFYTESRILKNITLSLFDTYGPKDTRPKFINLVLDALSKNEVFNMSEDNRNMRYVYIDDVTDAFCAAIDLLDNDIIDKSETYSVYGNEEFTLKELVNVICKITESKLRINPGAYSHREREIMFATPRFDKLPNWDPKINIENGIKNIINENK